MYSHSYFDSKPSILVVIARQLHFLPACSILFLCRFCARSPFILKQSLFFTNRWHCGIRVKATSPMSFEDSCKMLRSASMNMKKGVKVMENRIEGCRLQQKSYSVTKLLHKTNSLSLKGIEAQHCALWNSFCPQKPVETLQPFQTQCHGSDQKQSGHQVIVWVWI